MSQLAENLMHAWAQRGRRAADEFGVVVKAPSLFTNMWVERAYAELERAKAEVARWGDQA